MILKLTMDLPEDENYVRIMRLLGRTLLEYLQADAQDMIDLELLLGELCSNVIRHAHSCDGRFQVILECYAERVTVTVVDMGPGFSFKAVPEAGTPRPDHQRGGERIGGFGLQLVESLVDHLEFRRTDPHGTTVRAEKALHYQSREAAEHAALLDNGPGRAEAVVNGPAGAAESPNS